MVLSLIESLSSAIPCDIIEMDSNQLDLALEELTAGKFIRATAKKFHVSKDYLRRRIKGTITRKEFKDERQSLSPNQEQQLVDWVLLQARVGWAPPHSRFRLYALRIYRQSGGQITLESIGMSHFFIAIQRLGLSELPASTFCALKALRALIS